jgi:hypothetical protein
MPGEDRVMDKDIAQLYSVVDEILGFVRGPGRTMEIGEVERNLLAILMKVGRQALISYVEGKGAGYRGEEIVNGRGEILPYVRDRKCAYRSIFGAPRYIISLIKAREKNALNRKKLLALAINPGIQSI